MCMCGASRNFWGSESVGLRMSEGIGKQRVPFDFAQGRLSTPRGLPIGRPCSGRDDRLI